MCLIAVIKSAFKAALFTGRIYQQRRWCVFDPTPEHPAGTDRSWTNFSNYTRPLSADEWTLFQNEERNYRKTLDTKRFEDRQSFAFSGEKPAKWIKLICILNGLYFKNGTFTTHHKDGKPFGLPFLKYTVRVLKKFPRHSPTPEIHRAHSESGFKRNCAL